MCVNCPPPSPHKSFDRTQDASANEDRIVGDFES